MAISFVGQASAASSTVTYPAGIAAGDLLILLGYGKTSTSISPMPTGYANGGGSSTPTAQVSIATAFAVGTESGTTVTYTGSDILTVLVYRGADGPGKSSDGSASSTTAITIPSFTPKNGPDNTSWVISIIGSNQATSTSTPSGMTLRSSQSTTGAMMIIADTNTTVTTGAAESSTLGATPDWCVAMSLELVVNTKASTIVDTFNGSLSAALSSDPSGNAPTFTSNRLNMQGIFGGTDHSQVDAIRRYKLLGSQIAIQLWGITNPDPAGLNFFYLHSYGTNVRLRWNAYPTGVWAEADYTGNSINTSSTPVAITAGMWLRIRETAGTVYFEYSLNGINYSNILTVATSTLDLGGLNNLSVDFYVQDDLTNSLTTTLVMDNLNNPPLPSGAMLLFT